MSDFILTCPECEKDVDLGEGFLGHEVACKSCGGMVEIAHNPEARPEVKVFSDQRIKITNKRVTVQESSYSLKYVSSVGRLREDTHKTLFRWIFYVGLTAVVFGIAVVLIYKIQTGYNLIIAGAVMIAVEAFLARRPDHYLVVTMDGKDLKLLGGKDRAYIIRLVGKMKKALGLYKQGAA